MRRLQSFIGSQMSPIVPLSLFAEKPLPGPRQIYWPAWPCLDAQISHSINEIIKIINRALKQVPFTKYICKYGKIIDHISGIVPEFIFQMLAIGLVEKLCEIIKLYNVIFRFVSPSRNTCFYHLWINYHSWNYQFIQI